MKKLFNSPAFVGCILLVLVLLMLVTCNKCNGIGIYQPSGTIIKRDTVYLTVSDSTGWIRPEPDTVVSVKYRTVYRDGKNVTEHVIDTVTLYDTLYTDLLPGRFFVYSDSVKFDTAGVSGTVLIKDTTGGRIIARNVSMTWKLPTVVNTKHVERGAIYWGPLAQFNRAGNSIGISANWKTAGPVLFNGAVLFNPNGGQSYQIGAAFKIK
jgi:hypothetical protein